jgi:hypothetical protein
MDVNSRAPWDTRGPSVQAALIALIPAVVATWLAATGWFVPDVNKVLYAGAGTLVFGGLLGGALKILLDNVVAARGKRADAATFVGNILQDLKSVYDRTARTQILIAAHQSAKTYGDEMRALVDARVQLLNISRALERRADGLREESHDSVAAAVGEMATYLGRLTAEFQRDYKRVSSLQRTYEAQLTEATKRYATARLERGEAAREGMRPEQEVPNEPWERLKNLSELKEFIGAAHDPDESRYKQEFLDPLDAASAVLRRELAWILGQTGPERHGVGHATGSASRGAAADGISEPGSPGVADGTGTSGGRAAPPPPGSRATTRIAEDSKEHVRNQDGSTGR